MRLAIRSCAVVTLLAVILAGQSQPLDEGYSRKIKEFTTDPAFLTDLVDHLPSSPKVPTPEKALGYVAGAPDVLTYAKDVHRYMREVAKATPRVRVESMGQSEEGREMVLVLVSDESNLAKLDKYKEITGKLADPRRLSEADAEKLAAEGLVFYWATGAIHSPETGSPEMLMELVYRLAVSEHEKIRNIRKNLVVMITPVVEVDGRERQVDLYRWKKANPGKPAPPLLYWGKYVAHDNNRDGMALSLALSRNVTKTYLQYHPQVLHDLHESVPFLYTSTGMGPYNAWLDPIVITEWQDLAWHEVQEMTKRGVPGVWTFGFYDGWAANYMMEVAHGHNSIGRFYETFGNGGADTRVRTVPPTATGRAWFRQNPPYSPVKWSHRNNVNLQQSALLLALDYTATNRQTFLRSFYLKSKRSVAKARTEGPAGYVIDAGARPAEAASLVNQLRMHGVEVHRLTAEAQVQGATHAKGSYVVRMDQPYSRLADMVLDRQYYNPNDTPPYDDTGWTLGALRNLKTTRITDAALLEKPMERLDSEARAEARVEGNGPVVLVRNTGERAVATFRYRLAQMPMDVAEESFEAEGTKYPPGTLILREAQSRRAEVEAAAAATGVIARAVAATPAVKSHPLRAARIALVHTWTTTQNEGWARLALESTGIPYSYIGDQKIRETQDLRAQFDVIVWGPVPGGSQRILHGIPKRGEPLAWKGAPDYPNIGTSPDQSEDIRGGLGYQGLANLQRFIEEGGLFMVMGPNAALPAELGIVDSVNVASTPPDLRVRGSVLQASVADSGSPVVYGYGETLPVYYTQGSLLEVVSSAFPGAGAGPGAVMTRPSGRGGVNDPDVPQGRAKPAPLKAEPETSDLMRLFQPPPEERPRVLLRFAEEKELLISGMLAGGRGLAGKPALIDAPRGKGHVLSFLIHPMWRQQTQGSFLLVLNAAMNFDHLHVGRK
jgi:hypothetical protein